MALISARLRRRTHEYMNDTLLASQFATLESPEGEIDVQSVGIEGTAEQCADEILRRLQWGKVWKEGACVSSKL